VKIALSTFFKKAQFSPECGIKNHSDLFCLKQSSWQNGQPRSWGQGFFWKQESLPKSRLQTGWN
jgi:hypothetical protein